MIDIRRALKPQNYNLQLRKRSLLFYIVKNIQGLNGQNRIRIGWKSTGGKSYFPMKMFQQNEQQINYNLHICLAMFSMSSKEVRASRNTVMSKVPKLMQHAKFTFYHLLLTCESNHHGNWHEAIYTLYWDLVGITWCKVFLFPTKSQFCIIVKGVALLLEVIVGVHLRLDVELSTSSLESFK